MNTYYVYSFKCADGSLHTSLTRHLAERLQEHHQGKRARTKNRRPLELIYCTKFNSISDAIRSELLLKTKLQLI